MKKTIITLLVGMTFSATVSADDLLAVYQLAAQNDPIINRALAQKNAAYAAIDLSRANLLPQLSGSVSYTDSTAEVFDQQFVPGAEGEEPRAFDFGGDNETTTLRYGIDLNMSLYDHANWLGMDRAELIAQQSDANLGASLQGLMQRTVAAYLSVLREQDNVEFVKAELRAIERQLEQTKQRFEVGLTAITDVHEAQANFDNTVALQIRAENLVELRLEELREITNKYHDQLFVLDTDRFTPTAPSPATASAWLDIAKESNLALLAQRFAKDVAKEDIDIASSGHYPTLDLRGSYGVNDRDSETVLVSELGERTFVNNPPSLDSRNLTLQLNVPIYLGGAVSARTEIARSEFVVASENLELIYRETVRTVRSSFNNVKASISTIRALEQSVVSAESALRATEAGFDVGTRTIVDVLNSTRNLFDARRNLADARYNFIISIINLKRAAGTLTIDDLAAINQALRPAPAPTA
jgi:outer membrane protein